MQIGMITVHGAPIGVVALTVGDPDKSSPDFSSHQPLTLVHNRGPAIDDHAQHGRHGPSATHHHRPAEGGHHSKHPRDDDHAHGHGASVRHHSRKIREQDRARKGEDPRPDVGAGLSGSAYLKARRQRAADEINSNPALRRQVKGMMITEGAADPVPVAESLLNRSDYTGKPINSLLHSGFYGPINRGQLPGAMARLDRDPQLNARMDRALDAALGGSNLIRGATDQGLPTDPNGRWQGGRITRGGNVFNDWGGGPGGHEGARRYREQLMRGVESDTAHAGPALRNSETAAAPKDLIVEGNKGMHLGEQFKGTPKWGWDSGAWKDFHKSGNVDDRRNAPTKGHTTQELNRAKENKRQGDIDTMLRGHQNYDSKLSKDAGIDALKSDDSAGRGDKSYPPTIEGFKKKFGRDPETDSELEFYDK